MTGASSAHDAAETTPDHGKPRPPALASGSHRNARAELLGRADAVSSQLDAVVRWAEDGVENGSAYHALLQDKILARGNCLQQLRQFIQRWHCGPPLVSSVSITGLGAQPPSGFG
jgi:hypothetical protein